MNKREFGRELSKRLGYSIEKCERIVEILESHFFISKENESIIESKLSEELNVDSVEAKKMYDIAVSVVKEEIKRKMLHPFS